QTKHATDPLLTGTRSVTGLAAGQSSNGNTNVTIPSATALGLYYVLSCADDLNAVAESNETNNCRASTTTIQVTLPDLIVTAITIPSTPVGVGGTFKVSDTVKNQGAVAAGAYTKRYYLSLDQVRDGSDVLLTGTDSDSSLAAGQSSSSSNVTLTV